MPGPAPGTVLLLDVLTGGGARLFSAPREIVTTTEPHEVPGALERLEALSAGGAHLAGFLTYEAGHVFEEKLTARLAARPGPRRDPLLWFGVYDAPRILDRGAAMQWLREQAGSDEGGIDTPTFEMDRDTYRTAFESVRRHLAQGDIYQANLTMRATFRHKGSAAALFAGLLRRQPVGHAALVATGNATYLSLSPELFLERAGTRLTTRPMKGTAPRGRWPEEDRRIAAELAADPKSQAENLMIVDLMRNDLSRICETGSVEVEGLFAVERYRSLQQMVTTVHGRLSPSTGLAEIFRALYPCGSITGAPKLRAQEIIDDLEVSPRGIYTGSIGEIRPGGDFRFNVAIRTLSLRPDGTGEIGTGSGVVYDSDADAEYDECHLKLAFLTREDPPFGLIETFRFEPEEGYFLLARHLSRLARSASYFGFPFSEAVVADALARRAEGFASPRRVRLELSEDGELQITDAPLPPPLNRPWRIAVSPERMDASDPFLFHKTTRRARYDDERVRLQREAGCDEALFLNTDGLVTEGSLSNIFLERGGRLLTPTLAAGLLPGVLREALLDTGRAEEAVLDLKDLASADRLYMGNSLRGLIPAQVSEGR